ncbi:MAG: two-component regulator propeller domain-containing protein [Bacteroidota bacterium]
MTKRLHQSIVLYFFFISSSFSQDVKFSRIGSELGLSQQTVNCIMQDSKGYMWFGTQDGLNRFNGYEMTVFKHNPSDSNSISNNYVECLYEDKKGNIWIGTRGGGLNVFNSLLNIFTRFQYNDSNTNSLSNDNVKCIYEDINGTYWIGTSFGLNSFDGHKNFFVRYLQQAVGIIYADKKNRLWIGTYDGGLVLFDTRSKKFSYYNESDHASQFFRIKAITEDKSGILWIGTDDGGLISFDSEKKTFHRFLSQKNSFGQTISNKRIFSLVVDDANVLWIGLKNDGFICYNTYSNTFSYYRHNEYDNQSISSNNINCIYRDREGNIWIGTEGGGVNVHFPHAMRFRHYHRDVTNEKFFQSNVVFSILQDAEGIIWVGTMNGGITTIDRVNNVFNNYGDGTSNSLSNAKSNSLLSFFEDKDGLIWVGTWGGGVNTYNKKTKAIVPIKERGAITCISQGHKDIIWFGEYGREQGLFAYNKSAKNISRYSTEDGLSSNNIFSVYEDKNQRVWIGTSDAGLNRLDYKTGNVKIYQYKKGQNSISNNTVNCIYDNGNGALWIGTSNGLNKFDIKTETFTPYYESDGIANASIWGIFGDKKGILWISTNNGITRFNPNIENKDGSAFKNFTIHDGLQGQEFAQGSYFQNKNTGEIFFGGLNGFNSFFPDNISDNKHIPSVFITSFKKFGKETETDTSISDKKHIELSYKDNFISFEFVSLDYTFSARNHYSFKMEGLDNDWSPPSTRRYVSYTNLPGGNYIFRVRGSNSDGVWNNEGAVLYITVIPPWWKTNIFYVFSIIFFIALVFGFIHYRTSAIEKEKKILEVKVEKRTAELAQKNKDITSSIQYAKRIQEAILPPLQVINKHFPESFILYKPKDIVSGDFYWFGEKSGRKIIAAVDCTGHGVPGAFMSMIGTNLLNQIIMENGIIEPSAILSALDYGVRSALKQGVYPGHLSETTDGMDIAICSVDINHVSGKTKVQYSGAIRPLIIISNNNQERIEGNKFPIGGSQYDTERIFTNHVKFLNKGDLFYMFSDGYADQFGGEKGKKFMMRRLYELIHNIQNHPMKEQEIIMDKTIEDWKGDYQQVDDILVIGIRV